VLSCARDEGARTVGVEGSSVIDGTPAFASALSMRLRLLGTQTWPDSSNVLVRYAPAGEAG
jgi:hypothetical protein